MRETYIRLLSGIIYIVLLIVATLYSINSFIVLFGVFMVIAVSEFCDLVHLKKTLPIIVSAIGYLMFAYFDIGKTNDYLLLLASLFVTVKCMAYLFNKKNMPIKGNTKYMYLIGYIVIPFVLITKIPFSSNNFNPHVIISIFILIWTNDTFAYIVGKSIGKTKLLEAVSPKKTIEGLLGGIVFTIIASVIISTYYLEQSIVNWVITAIIVSVFGTIGDLVESKFKRNAGVKDSGKIMPGHGGILDRLDSVIFVAPFIFLLYQLIEVLQ